MATRRLNGDAVGIPVFEPGSAECADVFNFSSHARARDALRFGLLIADSGFNIFVLGEDRSGRMTATVAYLRTAMAGRPPPGDWVYLNNFRRPHRPRPYRLPAGMGRTFRDRMAGFVTRLRETLQSALSDEANEDRVRAETGKLTEEVTDQVDMIKAEANVQGLDIAQTPQGAMIVQRPKDEGAAPDGRSHEELEAIGRGIAERLAELNRWATRRQASIAERARSETQAIAHTAASTLLEGIVEEFGAYPGIRRWLVELQQDITDRPERFAPKGAEAAPRSIGDIPERRYSVNLFVDHGDDSDANVVVEANPTYQNLFGRTEYRQVGGVLETDFTLLRAGALHRANGGILVLRAEALADEDRSWPFLKGALRDGEIAIEGHHRADGVPLAGAPRPKSIPLDVKVVIIGHPRWYYTFFMADPDFRNHFKIKADIDPDMEANGANVASYSGLIRELARDVGATCDTGAVSRLLGRASRIAGDRTRLSAHYEMIADIIIEAVRLGGTAVDADSIDRAIAARRQRNARIEDRLHEQIVRGRVSIPTDGRIVGQVNGLTVRDLGDRAFGWPTRVTARAFAGRRGVINIERDVGMGGPIQQKSAMVLQGYLAGRLARRMPLSFSCSITFEQTYGDVEGDSATMAEIVAILSDLSDLPARQDIAITGSADQRGEAQTVAGVLSKVEGFFRACAEAGGLTGHQGVVVPRANEPNLVLADEVVRAVEDGRFHIWSVGHVEEAVELILDEAADKVFGRVAGTLREFNRLLAESEGSWFA